MKLKVGTDDDLVELRDALRVAFNIVTDEQWEQYQQQRRAQFMERIKTREREAA